MSSPTDQQHRTAGRRREEETEVFAERYAIRAGIESTNSGLKNRLGLGKLLVRGRGSVFRVIVHKVAGWNMLRAASSEKIRALVATAMAHSLGLAGSAQIGQLSKGDLDVQELVRVVSNTISSPKNSARRLIAI